MILRIRWWWVGGGQRYLRSCLIATLAPLLITCHENLISGSHDLPTKNLFLMEKICQFFLLHKLFTQRFSHRPGNAFTAWRKSEGAIIPEKKAGKGDKDISFDRVEIEWARQQNYIKLMIWWWEPPEIYLPGSTMRLKKKWWYWGKQLKYCCITWYEGTDKYGF